MEEIWYILKYSSTAHPQTKFAYNSTVRNSTGILPFAIVYRKIPYHLLDLAKLPIEEKFSSAASVMVEQVIDVQEDVRLKLEKSNAKYKKTTDKKRREKIFCKRDMVMVYLQKERIHVGAYNKLKPRKYGPFKIMKKISDNSYVVDLSNDMAMSKTFNVVDLYACYPTKQLYS